MRHPKDVLVTTTEKIDGLEIHQYLKPISAHIVTGTGFFSDFAASFSDVFGGRSQTYQKQLASIYNEAIESLKRTAFESGANCIVGLKVDLDEIAGKGKSMFMVTAVGTAVVIETIKKKKTENVEIAETISSDKMQELRKKQVLIEQAKSNYLTLDEQNWEFITENQVYEIADVVFQSALSKYIESLNNKELIYQRIFNYLLGMPDAIRIPILYKHIIENNRIIINSKIFLLIKELMAIDDSKLIDYLNSENKDIRDKALQVITFDKPFFNSEDIEIFEKYIDIIKTKFSKCEIVLQKKMLSSKEIELWKCVCDRKNEITDVRCENCGRDIYGFMDSEINPEKAIKILKANIEIIRSNTH